MVNKALRIFLCRFTIWYNYFINVYIFTRTLLLYTAVLYIDIRRVTAYGFFKELTNFLFKYVHYTYQKNERRNPTYAIYFSVS